MKNIYNYTCSELSVFVKTSKEIKNLKSTKNIVTFLFTIIINWGICKFLKNGLERKKLQSSYYLILFCNTSNNFKHVILALTLLLLLPQLCHLSLSRCSNCGDGQG